MRILFLNLIAFIFPPKQKTLNLLLKLILIVFCCFGATGCASILSRSNWPLSVQSNPAGANVVIKNKKGVEVFNGTTPAALTLRSGAGYFGNQSYIVTISMNGYESKTVNLECKINGWYFGNILIGGVLGMLVVDPLTGAMYRLDRKEVYENLTIKSTSHHSNESFLQIIAKDKIPENWTEHLVEIK